jgi:GntR family transcriptional regulator
MKKINLEKSPVPLHYQIADYLMMMLDQGELTADEKLPTEEQLRDIFSVSRTTIRKALDHLLYKGLLYRKQGKGTFWTDKVANIKKEKLSGINREIFKITQKTVAVVLSKDQIPAPKLIAEELGIPVGSTVIMFKRLRLADGEPMSFTINYLPPAYGGPIEKSHLEKMTMLETLESVVNADLGIIKHEVEITRANQEIAEILKISNLDPVLTVKTSVNDSRGGPIEVVWTHFVENKYKFRVVLDK